MLESLLFNAIHSVIESLRLEKTVFKSTRPLISLKGKLQVFHMQGNDPFRKHFTKKILAAWYSTIFIFLN